jgi:hypothetical protein
MADAYTPERYVATGLMGAGPREFGYIVLTAGGAAATADIRQGGAGGAIVLSLASPTGQSTGNWTPMVIQDPHVTLSGAGASLNVGV